MWGLYTVCRWMALIGNAPSRGVSFNSGYVGGYPWGTGTVPLETALLLNLRTLQLHPTSEVGFSILAAGGGAPEAPGWPEKGEHDDFGSS